MTARRQDQLARFSHALGNFVPDAISASVIFSLLWFALSVAILTFV